MRDGDTEPSPRLAALLGLSQATSTAQVVSRIATLVDEPVPQRDESRFLLAAAAELGDELADGFADVTDPDLVLVGDIFDRIEQLLNAVGGLDEGDLCRDLGITDTTFFDDDGHPVESPREALRRHLAGVVEVVVMELWRRGLPRAPRRPAPG